MSKKKVILAGGAVIFIVILLIVAFAYKGNKEKKQRQNHPERFFPSLDKPDISLTKPPEIKTFPIKNIPDQRKDINLQLTLEQRKESKKLSPAEEKTIIESLVSQIDIDKDKTFFDYK